MIMKIVLTLSAVAFFATVHSVQAAPEARPFVSPLFSDNMVLQRGLKAPVWGWTTPGQNVRVELKGITSTGTNTRKQQRSIAVSSVVRAGKDGKWMAQLGLLPEAGGPYVLTIDGPQKATFSNVMIGDVWLCSGQSNMGFNVNSSNNRDQEIAEANHPNLRFFTVPNETSNEARETLTGSNGWQISSSQTVPGFSAVAYFFGRDLQRELNVPIGLIHSSWGGTIAEAWTSANALKTLPDFQARVLEMEAANQKNRGLAPGLNAETEAWWAKNDVGSAKNAWTKPDSNDDDWKTMTLPVNWENAGLPDFDGIVWFRHTIDLPAAWNGKSATLHLGSIDDRDTTWVNGVRVGGLDSYSAPRDYDVPAGVLKAGRNTIAVRVYDGGYGGGIYGAPQNMKLESDAGALSLAGDWKYRVSTELKNLSPMPSSMSNDPNIPTVLYNAMIAPVVPYGIKGAIWYQGESNANRAYQYRSLLPTMIGDWRAQWKQGNFPFHIVQLANFTPQPQTPGDSDWAELREAQRMTAQKTPNVGLASAIDIGDANDIHPRNKQDVGKRLALTALAQTYGQKIEYSGPDYRAMKIEGDKIRLNFTHAQGLKATEGDLKGFAIAGADKKWHWADAKIDGDSVLVSSPQVLAPVAVRYAWANNPNANLTNAAGLPAVPFRTDDWPGITVNNK